MSQDQSPQQHYWDQQAATFDNEPDHGLRDPVAPSERRLIWQPYS